MTVSQYQLAAIAVAALHDVDIVGTRGPYLSTPDYESCGVMDAQGRHWIVKYPVNSLAGAALEAEASLATHLVDAVDKGQLPFDVIRPKALKTVHLGGRAMIYREPFGHPIPADRLNNEAARSIARCLGALHELSPDVYAKASLPTYSSDDLRQRLSATLEEAARSRRVPSSLLARWDRWVETDELWSFTPVPIHGDLDDDHVLWSKATVTAITGFGEASVGDPAEDFVWLANSLEDHLIDVVTETYAMARDIQDPFLLERVTLHSEFALVKWLLHGMHISSQGIIEDAEEMLSELEDTIAADPHSVMGPRWRVDPDHGATPSPSPSAPTPHES